MTEVRLGDAAASRVDPGAEETRLPAASPLPFWRRAMVFGTGFGIAIGERNLEAAIVSRGSLTKKHGLIGYLREGG
jgi:hypothetical protein